MEERMENTINVEEIFAQNVFTIHSKSFTGVDPENPNFGYPIPLTVTLGTKVTF